MQVPMAQAPGGAQLPLINIVFVPVLQLVPLVVQKEVRSASTALRAAEVEVLKTRLGDEGNTAPPVAVMSTQPDTAQMNR